MTGNLPGSEHFTVDVDIEIVRQFVQWIIAMNILATHEIPACWEQHRQIVDILSSWAVGRMGCSIAVADENYDDKLMQWWRLITEQQSLLRRWTDRCRRKHTADDMSWGHDAGEAVDE